MERCETEHVGMAPLSMAVSAAASCGVPTRVDLRPVLSRLEALAATAPPRQAALAVLSLPSEHRDEAAEIASLREALLQRISTQARAITPL